MSRVIFCALIVFLGCDSPEAPPVHATVEILVYADGRGTVTWGSPQMSCPPDCTGSILVGTDVTFHAEPAVGDRFGYWQLDGTAFPGASKTITVNGATTLIATFVEDWLMRLVQMGVGLRQADAIL